ncbi:MAG: cytochrome b/b6 domain-containing protein [Methylobacteriaceae bacterium]|nr:cytochrome b/b6 domain-containing protein [Methylobacteriaceae bacterium]
MKPLTGTDESRTTRLLVRRHSALVRVTHWVNVICMAVLLPSGLQIFNAHPRLYWGQYGADPDRAAFEIGAAGEGETVKGFARVGPVTLPTTGVLGVSGRRDGEALRAFPSWATLPAVQSLADGRRWHFFFAWLFAFNGLAYLGHGVLSGHLRRDVLPSRDQVRPSHLLREIADHARLRFPKGEAARRYNALQRLAYLAVVAILLPVMVLTGLCMSPAINAAAPWLVDLFGGRQSARTLHFISASLLVLFTLVHLAMVVLSGPWNNMRSMVTGRYAIRIARAGS